MRAHHEARHKRRIGINANNTVNVGERRGGVEQRCDGLQATGVDRSIVTRAQVCTNKAQRRRVRKLKINTAATVVGSPSADLVAANDNE